jgi:hypothetical protein
LIRRRDEPIAKLRNPWRGKDVPMTDHETAIEAFLEATDTALEEYDQGYVDADATLSVVRSHIGELRENVEE